MAATKKNTYISVELDWAEGKLKEWKDYVDANPLQELKHEIEWKPTSKGGLIPMVIATKQAQIKCLRDTLKEYIALSEVVDRLREKEDAKEITSRGDQSLSPFERGEI